MNLTMDIPGLKGVVLKKVEQVEERVLMQVEMEKKLHRCPQCKSWAKRVHDYRLQKIQHLKWFERTTQLLYKRRRYKCECGKRFSEKNPFVERYQRTTIEWNQAVSIRAVRGKTFKETAEIYGTSSSTVIRRFDRIAQTEISPIEELPKVIVIMDMSPSFKAAVLEALGRPVIVADRFHFCRYIYWALDQVRRRVQQEFDAYDRKKCKRMRHVFHKEKERLTDEESWYLKRYLEMSPELRKAYELKESYRMWFKRAKEIGAERITEVKQGLIEFYQEVESSGMNEMIRSVRTFQNWQTEILNSFVYNFSNGFLEGINNWVKVLKRNAFGYKSYDRFRAKILLSHQYKRIGLHIG